MNQILQKLRDYYDNTPLEQIQKDWEESEELDNVQPTVNEFIQMSTFLHEKIDNKVE